MTTASGELYASSNGDVWYLAREIPWYLAREGERVFVRHAGNFSSGGHASTIEIGAILARGHRPEQQALLRLIGTLAEGYADG